MCKKAMVIRLMAIMLLVAVCQVQAQEQTVHVGDEWEFTVAPYIWFAGMSGNVTINGTPSNGDTDFSEIADNLDVGMLGYFSARKGKWGGYVDSMYFEASRSGKSGPTNVTVKQDSTILEAGALYRAYEGYNQDYPIATDIYFGARFVDLDTTISSTGAADVTGRTDWVDPIIGATHLRDFSEKVTLTASGDVGGFGIGSDLTYSVRVLLGYRFNQYVNGWVGYRYLNIDYDEGYTANKMVYDVALSGPISGASFHF
jgi:hypothetical protein